MYQGVPTEEQDKIPRQSPQHGERAKAYGIVLSRLFTVEITRAARELWHDLCECRWRRVLIPFGVLSWLAALICAAMFSSGGVSVYDFCTPNDKFTTDPGDYNLWHLSDAFQITLAFGSLTFGQAKFIDIAFDIVVGRGGQALLAITSYYTFKRYLLTVMIQTPVSYGVYKGIFLDQYISFPGTGRLIGEFWRFKPMSSAIAMTWIILSASFIVSFSTLASAMTGYKPHSEAFVEDGSGNYLSFAGLFEIIYTINDASRINVTSLESFIFGQSPSNITTHVTALTDPYILKLPRNSDNCFLPATWATRPMDDATLYYFNCFLLMLTSEYVSNYGFEGLSQTTTWLRGQTLPSPALNVTAFHISATRAPYLQVKHNSRSDPVYSQNSTSDYRYGLLYGHDWVDPRTNKTPFADPDGSVYTTSSSTSSSNLTLRIGDRSTRGRCQPAGDGRFSWGFSFILLFICLVLIMVWTVGSYIMLLAAASSQDAETREPVPTEYKAIVDMTNAMDDEFHKNGEDLHGLNGQRIREFIKKDLKGGKMTISAPMASKKRGSKKNILLWLRDNKWWAAAFCVVSILTGVLSSRDDTSALAGGIFFAFVDFAILFARFVAKQKRGRWLSMIVIVIAGAVTAIVISTTQSHRYY